MPIDYYYMDVSPPCAAVNLCIAALGVPLNRKHINLFARENFDPEYIKLNPQHTIPMIVDDGFVLWDSHAINTYLVSKYAKDDSLYPTDVKKRALVDQRLYFEASALFPLGRNSVFPLFLKARKDIPQENIEFMQAYYEMVDKFLDGNKWIAGDQMTVADFSFIGFFTRMQGIITGVHQYKNITDWMELCKTTMIDFEEANQKGANDYIEILTNQMKS